MVGKNYYRSSTLVDYSFHQLGRKPSKRWKENECSLFNISMTRLDNQIIKFFFVWKSREGVA